jgi:hypothetical protein
MIEGRDRYGEQQPEALRAVAQRCPDALWSCFDGVYRVIAAAGAAG